MNQDHGKAGGFFSKMLQKVKGAPSELLEATAVAQAEGPDSEAARSQMLERKRRDDAIRIQEFAELRQLRNQGASTGQPVAAALASTFLPSALESQDRAASTLQKINAIEAQMAQQWWRNAPQGSKPEPARHAAQPAGSAALSVSDAISNSPIAPPGKVPAALPAGMSAAQWQAIPTLGQESMVRQPAPALVVVDAPPSSPGLEEAAILFAHGDVDSAKARVLALLVQELDRQPNDPEAVAAMWHAALDLYRAIGDEEGFEPLAIDYAAHFGRSAPLWFSMPQQLGMPSLNGNASAAGQRRAFRWNADAVLRAEAVTALEAAQAQADGPWYIGWNQLVQIDPAAVPQLARLLSQWLTLPGHFHVWGAERLLLVIEAQALSGDAARPPQWWALRMAVLHWLNRPEAFEQVALDYCVTYEVSPPSWIAPQCTCEEAGDAAPGSGWMVSAQESRFSTLQPGMHRSAPSRTAVRQLQPGDWEGLAGIIEGDATPWLHLQQARARLGEPLDISCDLLIGMDFVAVGSVLNWAVAMQAQGHQLRFTQMHRLVAVLFQVVGVQAHAALHVRMA